MPLPVAPRVLYGNSPLIEVVCQLCFPPILKIDTDVPAQFQDRVRREFPFYQTKRPDGKTIQNQPAGMIPFSQEPRVDYMTHIFDSADRQWRLSLSQRVLSLTARQYGQWDDFRTKLSGPAAAFAEFYGPPFYNHVCIRYRNVIHREKLGLHGVAWSELIRPWVSGPLGNPSVANEVEAGLARSLISLPEKDTHLELQYGLGNEEPSKIRVFLIETHTYTNEQTGLDNAIQRLNGLNVHARNFFGECITDKLRVALAPTAIG
jgi:uncharacterized protein (TIGR04255 family)